MVRKLSGQHQHLKEIVLFLIEKYDIRCYFCKKRFTEKDFPPRLTDNLTEHHISGQHSDSRVENRTPAHRTCHKSFHMKERRVKETEEEKFWGNFR